MGTFLDIEGAFDNVQPQVIIGAFNKFKIEANLKHIIYGLPCGRTVLTEWGSARAHRKVNKGTLQGNVLSALL